jgi:hypothetical protein
VPISEVAASFDHLIGAGEERVEMLMPRALAVLRLIISSYLFGACTGRSSARFSLLRIEYSEFYGVMCPRRPASGEAPNFGTIV